MVGATTAPSVLAGMASAIVSQLSVWIGQGRLCHAGAAVTCATLCAQLHTITRQRRTGRVVADLLLLHRLERVAHLPCSRSTAANMWATRIALAGAQ
jgi:hypothetical protein